MANSRLSLVCLAFLATVAVVLSNHHDKIRLRFKVSARNLKDNDFHGTVDPYLKLSYTDNNDDDTETKFGSTETLKNTENPNWSDVFTFDYDPSKRQKWHFVVKDDNLYREHDKDGEAWIDIQDYLDKNEYLEPNLSKRGYLIIQKA